MDTPRVVAQAAAVEFSVPSGDASETLPKFGRQAGLEVLFLFDQILGIRTHAVQGGLKPSQALAAMLDDTRLTFHFTKRGAVVVQPTAALTHPSDRQLQVVRSSKGFLRENAPLEEVTVTGTHLSGTPPVGVTLLTLTRADLDSQSLVAPQDLVRALPQVFGGGPTEDTTLGAEAPTNVGRGTGVNLRGLGARGTLVLLDGHRLAGSGSAGRFFDIANIPMAALERVDVLPFDMSAKYGADAIGGVVNFVVRRHFEGVELNGLLGQASGATLSERQLNGIIGTHWDEGNAVLFLEYSQRADLPAARRALATSNLTPWGGTDFDTLYGNPGTIVIGGQTWAVPAGQDGRNLKPNQFVPGTAQRYDLYTGADILPSERRLTVLGTLDGAWTDRWKWTAEGLWAERRVTSRYGGERITLLVPSSNPFYVNPTGGTAPVTVAYGFEKVLGPLVSSVDIQTTALHLIYHYSLSSRWLLTTVETLALQRQKQTETGAVNETALAAALSASDPRRAFDPFDDGSHTPPPMLAALREKLRSRVDSYEAVGALEVEGPLVRLPAGDLSVAAGGEWRRQLLGGSGLWTPGANAIAGDLGRKILGGYAELDAPLAGNEFSAPGVRELNLSGAVRYERYSDVAGSWSSYAGIDWAPTPFLSLRVSWAQSFRAPDLPDRTDIGDFSQPYVLPDSRSAAGYSSVLVLTGGNAALKPERARSWSLGFTLKPLLQQPLSIAMSYFHIRFIDRITQATLSANLLEEPSLQSSVTRGVSDSERAGVCAYAIQQTPDDCKSTPFDIVLDDRDRNTATLLTTGVDLGLRYASVLPMGQLDFKIDGTYILEYADAQTPDAPLTERRNTENNPLTLQLRSSAAWDLTRFGFTASIAYAGAYQDRASNPNRAVHSWFTVDGQVRCWIGPSHHRGTQLRLSAQNLFNRSPPFLNNQLSAIGYDEENADLTGRVLRLTVHTVW